MFELITTIGITAASVLLFGYWFRFACMLVLSAKTALDYAGGVARQNSLSFPTVEAQLQQGVALDTLRHALDRDYAVLAKLIQSLPSEVGTEKTLMAVNYRVLSIWYSVSSRIAPAGARSALLEMTNVVTYFANLAGEHGGCAAAA